ncbi:tetratricopeptide (TPR) repeat protein [Dysgonomonadaceae bacterium PH5-43]|nr:tetratricopeptide (TPR) repeat protein [Dysgonomonadaceae bacterium PH5-43]
MTKQEINKYTEDINRLIENRNLAQAFSLLYSILSNLQNWQLQDRLYSLESTYKTMLNYYVKGAEDSERDKVYSDIIQSLYVIADQVIFQAKTTYYNSLFYDKRRINKLYYKENKDQVYAALEDIEGKIALLSLLDNNEQNDKLKEIEKQKEIISQNVFNNIWLSDIWNSSDKENWINIINDQLSFNDLSCLIITATTLNLMEVFDENKALLLFSFASDENDDIRERAIVGIILFLRKYNNRLHIYPSLGAKLKRIAQDAKFINSIRHIILQFILSKETEKITKKINDELLPEVMKMKNNNPKSGDIFNIEDFKIDDIEDKNPEWRNIIEESGIQDKLQELSELQLEGADIMHSSFAHLKSFPFFNEVTNWFKPFSTPIDAIGDKALTNLSEIIKASTMLCNSDKYSFFMSLSQMPESYRSMMTGQLNAETNAIKEAMSAELNIDSKKINYKTRQYIQDLYRFLKIHPKRKDFEDIFDVSPEFYKVPSIYNLINDDEDLLIIGEYYFDKNYFTEAADIFNHLLETEINNDALYQKKGYCLQMMGNIEDALEAYQKAELINANNTWTIKKLAFCNKALKRYDDALFYYKKVEKLNPDNLSIQLNIGHCYFELKDYEQALKYYFKVEYLSNNKVKAQKAIAWVSFMLGKYEQASSYYDKIGDDANYIDFLNKGHIKLAQNKTTEAIKNYHLSWSISNLSAENFLEVFNNDVPELIKVGIKEYEIPFIIDSILYEPKIATD